MKIAKEEIGSGILKASQLIVAGEIILFERGVLIGMAARDIAIDKTIDYVPDENTNDVITNGKGFDLQGTEWSWAINPPDLVEWDYVYGILGHENIYEYFEWKRQFKGLVPST